MVIRSRGNTRLTALADWLAGRSRSERSERLGTASASERSNQLRIARRRAEEEGGEVLLVAERRRSRRLQSAIRAERALASGAIKHD